MRSIASLTALAVAAALAAPALAQPGHLGPYDARPGAPAMPPGYQPGYGYGSPQEPPPEGFGSRDRRYDFSAGAQAEDRRYAGAAERWAAENCIDQRNQQAAGAMIGGLMGAMIGAGAAGPHDRGAGAAVGGMLGVIAGSAIGASAASPGCPPGFYARAGAPAFAAPGFGGGYGYAAPPGYRPWIWSGERWSYRPYPYHRYWQRHTGWGGHR
ncbi:MAG: hypothetical protein JO127_14140 [Caulobacteraceae bacterium]|nr:hypothetical protein [Caulobacteraceae bacterium]